MKKLVVLLAFAVAGAAVAKDQSGKFGLGYQESFTANGLGAGPDFGSWSLKYGFNDKATGQFLVGFDTGKIVDDKFSIGARFLYDIVDNENSDFYLGLGFMFHRNKGGIAGEDSAMTINIPLGFEWSFAGLPEVGMSAEVGLAIDMLDGESAIRSVGGNVGGALGLGVHYYF